MDYHLTVARACKKYGLNMNTLRGWLRSSKKEIKADKVMEKWMINEKSLIDFLKRSGKLNIDSSSYHSVSIKINELLEKLEHYSKTIHKILNDNQGN